MVVKPRLQQGVGVFGGAFHGGHVIPYQHGSLVVEHLHRLHRLGDVPASIHGLKQARQHVGIGAVAVLHGRRHGQGLQPAIVLRHRHGQSIQHGVGARQQRVGRNDQERGWHRVRDFDGLGTEGFVAALVHRHERPHQGVIPWATSWLNHVFDVHRVKPAGIFGHGIQPHDVVGASHRLVLGHHQRGAHHVFHDHGLHQRGVVVAMVHGGHGPQHGVVSRTIPQHVFQRFLDKHLTPAVVGGRHLAKHQILLAIEHQILRHHQGRRGRILKGDELRELPLVAAWIGQGVKPHVPPVWKHAASGQGVVFEFHRHIP